MKRTSRFAAAIALIFFCLFWCFFGLVMCMAAFNEGAKPSAFGLFLFLVIWVSVFLLLVVAFKRLIKPRPKTARDHLVTKCGVGFRAVAAYLRTARCSWPLVRRIS